ncbi:hypothetical protein R69619_01706 [Paraburkholderia nemoris]|uniref:NACHT domain-containing protein n=1 Tax=Paraburkholderia nemoris TaxID=2793076 RepID=UPI00190A852E|nr:hypothetical protein [Paraburkholderia nemoris]MBK3740252.1 hypothetical protein [Paraburkholderia aspalathi]CAE6724287.1 hypothetical protein R69619_01706 [Paraburkholderia nemoris]
MADYDLSRLNPRSFERLVRALCFEKFGASGTVFSSGPDGARDFAIEGSISGYEPRHWDGYLVVQAKFRERLLGGTSDVEWLIKELKGELAKYQRNSHLRRPNYYIISTNVALSGADGAARPTGKPTKGGYSKVAEALEEWKGLVGIRDFDIWPSDKIVDLLAAAPGIRQTYLAWVTSGDVLQAALQQFQNAGPNFDEVMRRSLKNLLRKDQFAGLKDAGDVVDSYIRTSQVFIDLPIDRSMHFTFDPELTSDTSDESEDWFIPDDENAGNRPEHIVALVAERAKEKFEWEDSSNASRRQANTYPSNKIVLLGGPGQGKSTASLFLAQLFRAAIVASLPTWKADANLRHLVPEILGRAHGERITPDIPRRYPVFVSLPTFADNISKAKANQSAVPTLLAQMAKDLEIAADETVDRGDLRNWLRHYPWIVILDGLDEVPPSGERSATIDAISAFVSEIADARADALIIVTTRPQGYNDDLATDEWEHIYLTDLDADRALAYAESLSLARYQADPERRSRLQSLLEDAVRKQTTSRLMSSPLQVTIMHAIVDTGSSVPNARWTLFNEYFEILRKREKAKGGENQRILERSWSFLGQIHQHAGLILQTNSELAGSAGAVLSHDQFRQMLDAMLRAGGHTETEIRPRVDELLTVALHRLVLLSSREEGRISFDVRSLQEYMAAAALTSGNQIAVEARLAHIAGLSHWRHVFLIAASRCFSEDAFFHLRSVMVGIPRNLETCEIQREARNGARLALEMFADGLGTDHPIARRQLAQHALELLDSGPANVSTMMTVLVERQTEDLIFNAISEAIAEGDTARTVAAWKLLLLLASKFHRFLDLAEKSWPVDTDLVIRIVESLDAPLPSSRLVDSLLTSLGLVHPQLARQRLSRFLKKAFNSKEVDHKILCERLGWRPDEFDRRIAILPGKDGQSPFNLQVTSYNHVTPPLHETDIHGQHPGWSVIAAASQFSHSPSQTSLSQALIAISELDNGLRCAQQLDMVLPWPLASLVAYSKDHADMRRLAEAAQTGELGDAPDWAAAETRWNAHGIRQADFLLDDATVPFDRSIGQRGAPTIEGYSINHGDAHTTNVVRGLAAIGAIIRDKQLDYGLPSAAHFAMLGLKADAISARSDIVSILDTISSPSVAYIFPEVFGKLSNKVWKDAELVAKISAMGLRCIKTRGDAGKVPVDRIAKALRAYPEQRGLLCLVAVGVFSADDSTSIPVPKIPRDVLKRREGDAPAIEVCSCLLSIAQGYMTLSELSVDLILSTKQTGVLVLVRGLLQSAHISRSESTIFLLKLIRGLHGKRENAEVLFRDYLKRNLDQKKSDFAKEDVWIKQMDLPADAFEVIVDSPQ